MHSGKEGYATTKISGLVKQIKVQESKQTRTTIEVDGW
jgi:hypothetical protein